MTKYYAHILSEYGNINWSAGFYDSIEDAKNLVEKEKTSILQNLEEGEVATLRIYEQGTHKRVYTEYYDNKQQ